LRDLISGRAQLPFSKRIDQWNNQLSVFTKGFQNKHKDARVGVFETGPSWEKILENPPLYGYRDDISACQSNDCMWNTDEDPAMHPKFGVHRVLAQDLAEFLETY